MKSHITLSSIRRSNYRIIKPVSFTFALLLAVAIVLIYVNHSSYAAVPDFVIRLLAAADAPTITAAAPLTRQQGATAINSQIATVSDADQTADTLTVTATPLTGTGVSINNISIDGSGNVTADVAASCTATNSTFTLTVTDSTNATASDTLTVNVTANSAPTITPGGPTTFCAGGSVTLSSSSASGNQWNLNGNPIGGATNQDYIANASGDYTVTVTDGNNCSATSAATTVTVNPLPATPTITPGGPTTFCAGGGVTLSSSSATGNQWKLNGNPIGGATNQDYIAAASGDYTVTVTDGNNCSATSSPTTVTVNPVPATPTITPGGPTTFCDGGSVTLSSSSASGNQWFLDGNPIGGGTNQDYIAAASGNYTVTVTASGCSSAPSAATTVTVQPNSITVTNLGDSGNGSLRQAILDVCAGGGTIDFNPALTSSGPAIITLTSGELLIDKIVTINGPTNNGLTISGNSPNVNASRIFNINTTKSLTFSNLTIANGKSAQGGGILNAGTLTITNSTFTNNTTTGGADVNSSSAGGDGGNGGAIYSSGTLTLINSTISGNHTGRGGDNAGTGNGGNSGAGAGIYNSGNAKSTNSTIANNQTGRVGAANPNNPIPGNPGNPGAGGIFTGGTLILNNTIVATNLDGFFDPNDINGAVDPTSNSNLIGAGDGMTGISDGSTGNQVGTAAVPLSPHLGALANNGGPTFTHLPQNGSPVLDAGSNALAVDQNSNPLTTDQRGTGFDRILPTGGTVEIGAVEVNYGPPGSSADIGVTKSSNPDSALADTDVTYTITVSNSGPNAATNASLTDALPPEVTFVQLSPLPGGWSCNNLTPGSGGTLTCNNPSMPLTNGAVFTLVVHIKPGTAQSTFITNQAQVSTSADDPNSENDSSAASTLVIGPSADVGVTKIANADISRADRDVVYTITVSNGGPTAAANVSLTDTLPLDMTFVSKSSAPAGWTCNSLTPGSGGTLTCMNPSLAVTSGQVFTLVGHIPPGASNGTLYFNQATVSSDTSDPNPDNNSSPAGTTVVACLTDPVVTTNTDSGTGSLRQAIADACDGSTITFDMTQVVSPITLTSAELLIDKDLTITGPGANLLTIRRDSANVNRFRIFTINSGKTVNVSGVTITGGRTADGGHAGDPGGGIYNLGTLTLTGVAVSGNRTGGGTSFGGFGGGILSGGTLTVINSTISGNQTGAGVGGGGDGGNGGGINGVGTLTLTNSTISGNQTGAGGGGGGIGGGFGGGIYVSGNSSTLTLTGSTITGNSTGGTGGQGGGSIVRANGTITIKNTIIGGNTAPTGPDIAGAVNSEGFNLIGNDSGANITPTQNSGTDILNQPAQLFALADNGGPTKTHLLLPGSPAINTGDPNFTSPPTTDQRGFARVSGGRLDIGAVETNYIVTATAGTPQSTTINSAFATALKATVTESGNPQNGVSVTFTAPASGASGAFPGPSATAVVATNSSGVATAPTFTANGTAGSYNVVASIGTGLPTAAFALTNNKAPTATSVASSVNPSEFGQNVMFTATVTSTTGTPTGTVQFTDGANNLGAAMNCVAGGGNSCTAQVSTSALTAGTHTISATYSGDANFLGSVGTLSGGQVVKAQPSLSINDVSITEGDSGTKTLNFTATLSAASSLTVKVDFATANGSATAGSDYLSTNGTLTFNPGDLTKTIGVTINGDQNFEPNETFTVNLTNPVNVTISKTQGTGTITNDDAQGGIISFSQSNYSVNEDAGFLTLTVNRSGDTTGAATVDYATSDDSDPALMVSCAPPSGGVATSRCDFTTALGTLRFAAGETSKTFVVLISQDAYIEGPEAFPVALSNLTGGAVFAAPSTAMVTINDVAPASPGNPIDIADIFVKQHYRDFLNREADAPGLAFWTNEITSCGSNAACIEVKRIHVSAAFFLSIEFMETGGYAIRMQRAAFGKKSQDATRMSYLQFINDARFVGDGVVIQQPGADAKLNANKDAYATQVVTSTAFTNAYGAGLTGDQFVTALFTSAGVTPTPAEQAAAVAAFGAGGTAGRAAALRSVADSNSMRNAEFSPSFVLLEYFGYMRRNPDPAGYNFWLNKLNAFNGDFIAAEMVKAFILSDEYRKRFGP